MGEDMHNHPPIDGENEEHSDVQSGQEKKHADHPIQSALQTDHTGNPLQPLFTDQGYSDILVHIFVQLSLPSASALSRTSRHVQSVFTSSSKLQLSWKRALHSLRIPTPSPAVREDKDSSSQQLKQLLETQKRLDDIVPSSIRCLHAPNSTVVSARDGLLLLSESFGKQLKNPATNSSACVPDGWSVWDIEGSISNPQQRGAIESQGLWRWKTEVGETWGAIAMCPSENVLAVARIIRNDPSLDSSHPLHQPTDVTQRIYFYTLIPQVGTKSVDGVFQGGVPHPEAAFSYIDVILPPGYQPHDLRLELRPGGKVTIGGQSIENCQVSFLASWDWKSGLSLGMIVPTCHARRFVDFTSFGPFLICSFLGEKSVGHEPTGHASKPEAQNDSSHRKGLRSHKAYGPRSYKTKRPFKARQEEGAKPDRGGGLVTLAYTLDVFQFLSSEDGKQAPNRSSLEWDTQCTWHMTEIPKVNGIAAFDMPPFDSSAILDRFRHPLFGLISSTNGEEFVPGRFAMDDCEVDAEFFTGARDTILSIDLDGHIESLLQISMRQCQVQISLSAFLREISDILILRLLAVDGMTVDTALDHLKKLGMSGAALHSRVAEFLKNVTTLHTDDDGAEWEEIGDDSAVWKKLAKGLTSSLPENRKGRTSHTVHKRNETQNSPQCVSSGTVDHPWTAHYHTHSVPWQCWSHAVNFDFEATAHGWAFHGTRGVLLSLDVPDDDGNRKEHLVIRDFHSPRATMAGFDGGEGGSYDNDAKLESTRLPPCTHSLVSPVARPMLIGEVHKRIATASDEPLTTYGIFSDENLKSGMSYKESKVELELVRDKMDTNESLTFDGKRIYIAGREGMRIISF